VKGAPFFPDKDSTTTGKPVVMYVVDVLDAPQLTNGARWVPRASESDQVSRPPTPHRVKGNVLWANGNVTEEDITFWSSDVK